MDKYFKIKLCKCDIKNVFTSENRIFCVYVPIHLTVVKCSYLVKKIAQNADIFPAGMTQSLIFVQYFPNDRMAGAE